MPRPRQVGAAGSMLQTHNQDRATQILLFRARTPRFMHLLILKRMQNLVLSRSIPPTKLLEREAIKSERICDFSS